MTHYLASELFRIRISWNDTETDKFVLPPLNITFHQQLQLVMRVKQFNKPTCLF